MSTATFLNVPTIKRPSTTTKDDPSQYTKQQQDTPTTKMQHQHQPIISPLPLTPIFTNPQDLKQAYETYHQKSQSYYLTSANLTPSETLALKLPQDIQTRTQIGEILLLLVGLKPSVLICPNYQHIRFATELINHAIKPVFESVPNIEILPCDALIEIETGANFKGQWVLLNRCHPTYPKVKQTLCTGIDGIHVSKRDIGIALGYPVGSQSEYNCQIEYMSGTKEEDYVWEFDADLNNDSIRILNHFVTARRACRVVMDLKMRLGGVVIPDDVVDALVELGDARRIRVGFKVVAGYINEVKSYGFGSTGMGVVGLTPSFHPVRKFIVGGNCLGSSEKVSDDVVGLLDEMSDLSSLVYVVWGIVRVGDSKVVPGLMKRLKLVTFLG
ncbi:hypothetical protein HDU76_010659, partial [Blyttiomyces sp. JEL0837]